MQTLLDENKKAVSPFPEHAGCIQFTIMTLALYKRWQKWLETAEEGFGVARFVRNDGQLKAGRFNYNSLDMLLQFAESVSLNGLDNANADNWPLEVAVWAADAAEEWLNSQISFRRYQRGSVVAPEGSESKSVEAGAMDNGPVE